MARIDGLRVDGGHRFMQNREMYAALKDRGMMQAVSKLVNSGGSVGINGVYVTVISREQAVQEARRLRRNFVQRVYAECDCGRAIPFGKLGQHRKACTANVFTAPIRGGRKYPITPKQEG